MPISTLSDCSSLNPANISAPSPRIAPRLTQDVINFSQLHNEQHALKISANGAGTGQFDIPNATAKFVLMAQRNKRFKVPGWYIMCSNLLFCCAITTNYHRTADPRF